MQLLDYMRARGLDDDAFAEKVGDCTADAVKKWKYRERIPRPHQIARIEDVTRKQVTLRDWIAPVPERARAS
jgi:hypothetical protein